MWADYSKNNDWKAALADGDNLVINWIGERKNTLNDTDNFTKV